MIALFSLAKKALNLSTLLSGVVIGKEAYPPGPHLGLVMSTWLRCARGVAKVPGSGIGAAMLGVSSAGAHVVKVGRL